MYFNVFVDKVWIFWSHHCCYFQSTGLGQSREEQKRREMSAIASDEVKYLLQNYFRNNTAHKLWIGRCWRSLIFENNNENVNQVARRSGSSKVLLKSNRGEREVESLVKVVIPGRDPAEAEEATRLEDLATQYLSRLPTGGFSCSICSKVSKDRYAGKCHLDSKHFPSEFGHSCRICGYHCKSKAALACHVSIYHRNKWRPYNRF